MIQYIQNNWLQILQLAVSVLLIVAILLQQRGSGIGGAFGQSSASYSTKRGAEKILFIFTIIFAILFFVSAFSQFILR